METQRRQVEELIAQHHWRVVAREVTPDWWVDELWTIESPADPGGSRQAFVTFLVDPQASVERAKGQGVWAVSVTRERPTEPHHARPAVPLRPNWERVHRAEFAKRLQTVLLGES